MNNPIYIIGVGAIGMTLAVLLKQAGKDVTLIRGRQGSPAETDEASITVDSIDGTSLSATVPVRSLEEMNALNGPVLLTSKSFGNRELAQRLNGKTGQSPLVLLQNGLGVEDPFLEAGFPRLYRCVLLATSQVQAPYVVRYKPVAASPVGVVRGHETELSELVATLTTPQFPFRAEVAIQQAIWEKVITNCVFNAICPLLDVDNGIFYRNESALALAREVIDECLAVAKKVGVGLDRAEVEQRLLQISQRSEGQLISTLVDINQGRETEIDSLNLAVARLADRLDQPELATKTRLLGELTRLKAEKSRIL
ncbi:MULTISPECIES: ketopantoate reductase family protein [unclassified Spirosoma]|uniref:ketopantoate reductase family protein n=1 Tax=unclassified Spirosoma TaxID=2621999 RepID=UPI000966E406|nr:MULTISPECIES: 2-dehydropantoate 2-reductase [unclassified Spirosoma]MBN8820748.1 2-dehydropantoate 2-reductase [Spirosoma sp.]OJW70719.1 MAG: 2-dehydropantoate 2-reductase [Spirosoma sp. 48-14]